MNVFELMNNFMISLPDFLYIDIFKFDMEFMNLDDIKCKIFYIDILNFL